MCLLSPGKKLWEDLDSLNKCSSPGKLWNFVVSWNLKMVFFLLL